MSKGFIQSLFSFIAFFIGLAAATKLSVVVSKYLADHFHSNAVWLPFLSFVLIFATIIIVFYYAGKVFEKTTEAMMLGWLNKFGGVCIYLLLYGVFFSVIIFYAEQMKLIGKEKLNESVFYPYFSPLGPWLLDHLGKIIPFFKNIFLELQQYFEGLPNKVN
jgi:membrane protein required for colicin V production